MKKDEVMEIAKAAVREVLSRKSALLQEEYDSRYRDVKLLMKNYRKLRTYYSNVDTETLEVSTICEMRHKTKLMMSHVEKMLTAYKALCLESEIPEETRRWEVLYLRYMADERKSLYEIADSLHVDKRTLYRDTERALEDMAVLLFGIEAIGSWKPRRQTP